MRRRLCVIAALLLPAYVSAQSRPTSADQSASAGVAQTFRAFGRPYGAYLLAAFDSIPAAQYSFRPTPIQQSIGYIAQHLENANYELCALINDTKYVRSAKDSLADTVKARWPKDTLTARVRASLVYCGDAIGRLTDARLADTLQAGPPGAREPVLRVRYLILLVTDLAEHYAQLATYMRILGLVPPSALPPSR
jgi:hypothetical protein